MFINVLSNKSENLVFVSCQNFVSNVNNKTIESVQLVVVFSGDMSLQRVPSLVMLLANITDKRRHGHVSGLNVSGKVRSVNHGMVTAAALPGGALGHLTVR